MPSDVDVSGEASVGLQSHSTSPTTSQPVVKDPDYATEHYDEAYFEWVLRNKDYKSAKLRRAWVARVLAPGPGDRVVDLGCGAGVMAQFVGSKGASVHGVDLHPMAVATAERLNADNDKITFEIGDASDLPHLSDASFDKAMSCDVTEHCGYEVMMGIFREAYRLLKPGGTYFVYTPNPLHWIERLKEWGVLKQHPTHTGLRTAPVIAEALEKAGFEVVANPPTASMIPGFNAFEWLWRHQPVFPQLGNYRVILLVRKPRPSR